MLHEYVEAIGVKSRRGTSKHSCSIGLHEVDPTGTRSILELAQSRETRKLIPTMDNHVDCSSGVKHEGVAEGQIVKFGKWDVYVSRPTGDYAKDKAILFFTDGFGVQLINNQLMADDFARKGFQVYMPDYFQGDPITDDVMSKPEEIRTKIWTEWLKKHDEDTAWPAVRTVVDSLKADGVKHFGAVGFCYGAPFVVKLAQENAIKAGVVSHPSSLKVPEDLEKLVDTSNVPMLFNTCEFDVAFNSDAQARADELLGDGKYKAGYERTYWKGCTHGFAVRGDMSNPDVKAGKEGAFKATVDFFAKNI